MFKPKYFSLVIFHILLIGIIGCGKNVLAPPSLLTITGKNSGGTFYSPKSNGVAKKTIMPGVYEVIFTLARVEVLDEFGMWKNVWAGNEELPTKYMEGLEGETNKKSQVAMYVSENIKCTGLRIWFGDSVKGRQQSYVEEIDSWGNKTYRKVINEKTVSGFGVANPVEWHTISGRYVEINRGNNFNITLNANIAYILDFVMGYLSWQDFLDSQKYKNSLWITTWPS